MKAYPGATIVFSVLMAVLLAACAAPTGQMTPEEEQSTEQSADKASAVESEASSETEAGEAGQEISSEGSWEPVLERQVEQPVRMAAFFNETFAVTGGATGKGKTHYSIDGGATWTRSEESGGCLFGVDIVDEQTVWVCGQMVGASFTAPGGVRLSIDGGQTWGEQANYRTISGLCLLSFIDAQTGWFVSGNKLNATLDGGVTVEKIALPVKNVKIEAISLVSATEGYMLDDEGNLYITQDGGAAWETKSLGMARFGDMRLSKQAGLASAAMRFFDRDSGIVIMSLMGEGAGQLVGLRTADGGQTWQEERISSGIGVPYITRNGMYLTVFDPLHRTLNVFKYVGS